MGTDLERREVLNPVSGEVLDLTAAAPHDLGAFLHQVREWKREWLAGVEREVQAEVHRRMDFDGSYTIHLDGFDLQGRAPGAVAYDGPELRRVLQAFVDLEKISQKAADAACKVVTEYKPVKRGIDTLLKRGDEVSDAIRACGTPVDPERRYVQVVEHGR